MTVADSQTVDGLGLAKDRSAVVLVVADHLPWDQEDHFSLLEKKIGNYLSFVQSGQLTQHLPGALNLPVQIDIRCQFEPRGRALAFLEAAKTQLADLNVQLTYGLLPKG